jgi:hypothetical protein
VQTLQGAGDSLSLHQFNKQVRLGHEPRDLAHPKSQGGNGTAQKKRSKPGKMLDGPTDIRHLVGRRQPERSRRHVDQGVRRTLNLDPDQ